MHGLIGADHDTIPLAGGSNGDAFVPGYRRNGVIEGVLGWNRPGDTRRARAWIGGIGTESVA